MVEFTVLSVPVVLLYWKQVFHGDKSERSACFFFFLPFRSKEEKMIDSQVVLQTTCFVPEWWRMD